MSRSKSKRSAPKHQKAKLAVLPLLLAVLGYVLLADSGSEDDQPVAAPTGVLTASRPLATSTVGAETRGAQAPKLPAWSELATSSRTKCNPFLPMLKEEAETTAPETESVLPPTDLQPAPPEVAASVEPSIEADKQADAQAATVAGLSQQPVRYFFQTNNRRVMLVGDQLLSEGQTLQSYTVTRLEPNRIDLEPAHAKP